MNESYITTSVGDLNEDAYAAVIKIGHPSSGVVILKHETSVMVYDIHTLSHNSVRAKQTESFLDIQDAQQRFLERLGEVSKEVFSSPTFRTIVASRRRTDGAAQRYQRPNFLVPIDRDRLCQFAQGSINGYQSFVAPPSKKHLKPRYLL